MTLTSRLMTLSTTLSLAFSWLRRPRGIDLALSPADLDLPAARLNWSRHQARFQRPHLRVIAGGRTLVGAARTGAKPPLRLCASADPGAPMATRRAS